MKSLHRIILTAMMIFFAFGLGGCASQVSQMPVSSTPSFTTEDQKDCARGCQSTYACCTRSCNDARQTSGDTIATAKCTDNCKNNLEKCYQICSPSKLQVPGETVADDQLVLDTIKAISFYSLGKHKCPYISVVDTKRIKTEGVIEGDSQGRMISGNVFEEWTVDQCGTIETYQVTYKPDGKGGTFVNVRPQE
jgi:hypothetical protein